MIPLLSVIIPIYNAQNYLRKCIDSILIQDFRDFELILINDGSTDNSSCICNEYVKIDNRVSVIHKENEGLVNTRKKGLMYAKGEYICFIDSDDWIENNYFSIMYDTILKRNVDIVICGFYFNYGDFKVESKNKFESGFYDKEMLIKYFYPKMLFSGEFFKFGIYPALWNKVIRKSLLLENIMKVDDRIKVGEDVATIFPTILDANSIYLLNDQFLYNYRLLNTSMTRSYDKEYYERILILFNVLFDAFKNKESSILTEQLDYYILYMLIASIENEYSERSESSFKEKISFLRKIIDNSSIVNSLHRINKKKLSKKAKLIHFLLTSNNVVVLNFCIIFYKLIRRKS